MMAIFYMLLNQAKYLLYELMDMKTKKPVSYML